MELTEAAARFLDALDDAQRAEATAPFEDEALRRDWHYIPRKRPGLSFRRMSAEQEQLVYSLVATMLSTHAFAQAATIIALEDVLDLIEGGHRHRHRADYSTIVFGDPADAATWGLRFEGHHVSLNITVVDGEVASTPLFLGANPAEVPGATRPLEREEHLARHLLELLGDDAVVPGDAPEDILTTALPKLEELPEPLGVRRADLVDNGEAASAFDGLISTYLTRTAFPTSIETGDVRFCWMGSRRPREPHYYRLQGPRFLVEYDNRQDGANHIHTVVRDPDDDFGDDLLRRHLTIDH